MKILPAYTNKEEIPWEVIGASLQGELTAEEVQTLSLSPAGQEKYVLWQWLWREMLADYELYLQMNLEAALDLLRERILPGR
ncbi:MAG: hypothetical protein JST42_13850 [Bacteroidetes bacterium]|nr:hypothetical protein [Bacteroidota bacterium]